MWSQEEKEGTDLCRSTKSENSAQLVLSISAVDAVTDLSFLFQQKPVNKHGSNNMFYIDQTSTRCFQIA